MAVVRIDGCADEVEGAWLGERIRDDLLTHIRHLEGRKLPRDAVISEHVGASWRASWSVAVYVTLGSNEQAQAMKQFLTAYATPTAN